ncbi:PREDICTED: nucleoside diphosphate kinase, mitochondrial [Myotis davidii]|uniref:nucleoside diphosphate kinase, mitochondrial n=1 Tax=Myotis davidii TaxID=225400 RepID=UPI0003EBC238|nr:PREDICTED: nucleoside diphosphate kinase, mitochondrial [Myotis davidii]
MSGLFGRAVLREAVCGSRAWVPSLLVRPCSGGPSWTLERTLVAVKPDGVQRRLVGDVIRRFETRGFKLVGVKMIQAPESILAEHYHDLQRKPFYPALISYMSSGPVVAMVWEGPNVVCTSRAMIGHMDSAEAAPGTIRGDFSFHNALDSLASTGIHELLDDRQVGIGEGGRMVYGSGPQ